MNIPNDLLYSKSHEWVKTLDDGNVLIGITDYAQSQMGDVVFVNLCDEGDELLIPGSIGDIESIKDVSDVYSPVSGTVVRVNDAVLSNPSQINSAPYESWLAELSDVAGLEALLSAGDYEALIQEL